MSQYGKAWHKGMLEVKNVPGFTDILIHKGNKEKHTAGCLLVGDVCHTNRKGKGEIQSSKLAYDYIYPIIRDILLKGEEVYITYRDFDSE